ALPLCPTRDNAGGPVEVPFARLVEGIGSVFDIITGIHLAVRRAGFSGEGCDAFGCVHRADRHADVGPGQQGDQFDIARFGPFRPDVAVGEADPGRISLRAWSVDPEESLVRRAGALAALAVHIQFAEHPGSVADAGHLRLPQLRFAVDRFPADDPAAA